MCPRKFVLTTVIATLFATSAWAQKMELTPFIGYRFGGSFADYYSGARIDLNDAESYGAIMDFSLGLDYQIEVIWSHQSTTLDVSSPGPGGLFDMDVDYFHVGGIQLFDDDASRPFLVGSLGASRFNPEAQGFGSYTRFSLSAGGGIKLMPNDHIGLRLEGRVYATFATGNGAVFCGGPSGGCAIGLSGSVIWQVEFTAGLILGFGS